MSVPAHVCRMETIANERLGADGDTVTFRHADPQVPVSSRVYRLVGHVEAASRPEDVSPNQDARYRDAVPNRQTLEKDVAIVQSLNLTLHGRQIPAPTDVEAVRVHDRDLLVRCRELALQLRGQP